MRCVGVGVPDSALSSCAEHAGAERQSGGPALCVLGAAAEGGIAAAGRADVAAGIHAGPEGSQDPGCRGQDGGTTLDPRPSLYMRSAHTVPAQAQLQSIGASLNRIGGGGRKEQNQPRAGNQPLNDAADDVHRYAATLAYAKVSARVTCSQMCALL